MKNLFKLKAIQRIAGIIALAVLFVIPAVSYGQSGGNSTPTFTSIDDFDRWLDSQPVNTARTPYSVKLNVRDISGLTNILRELSKKYVSLDLSGCSFTNIRMGEFVECRNLVSITLPNSVTRVHTPLLPIAL
jgi:hypothetical protein